jgi:hypothetical protein
MKQNIHNLALQAGLKVDDLPDTVYIPLEKFAESLIEECIRVVGATPMHCAMTTFQQGIVKCTISESVKTLKEHFE